MFLQVLKQGTLFFSRDSPSLAQVIPGMDYLDGFLTDSSRDLTIHPAIRGACKMAKETLNRYYSLTDAADSYRITISTCSRLVSIVSV
jgi:hypothetical protein